MFYGFETQFKNLNELKEAIPKYISYYNKQRIKVKLKGLSPIE
ncbi:IS3 family transposase [Lactobacillus sp. B4012]|nr:IS3 family transposase [Lactobacillus sp. B4010]MCX8731334.1 IS3 family transposase [Lactobacillus sp. B4015]MCX8733555.1 IS3 family transposase [Lactobacillus sp. B4012]